MLMYSLSALFCSNHEISLQYDWIRVDKIACAGNKFNILQLCPRAGDPPPPQPSGGGPIPVPFHRIDTRIVTTFIEESLSVIAQQEIWEAHIAFTIHHG